jgi:hypothetical protein
MARFARDDDATVRAMLGALADGEEDLTDAELAARAGVGKRDAVAALERLRYLGLVSLAYERGSAEFRYALTPAGKAQVPAR